MDTLIEIYKGKAVIGKNDGTIKLIDQPTNLDSFLEPVLFPEATKCLNLPRCGDMYHFNNTQELALEITYEMIPFQIFFLKEIDLTLKLAFDNVSKKWGVACLQK